MFASVPSKRVNSCAQIYVNDLEWCRAYTLITKGDAHTSLDLLFTEEELPNTMISDNSMELHTGEFRCKCIQAGVYCKETEPYYKWMNRAKGTKDGVHPNISPTISFSGMNQKSFIYCRNRKNSQ